LLARGRDLKMRFDALQIFLSAAFKALLQFDLPFLFQARMLPRKKVQYQIFAFKVKQSVRVGPRKSRSREPRSRGLLGLQMSRAKASRIMPVRQPDLVNLHGTGRPPFVKTFEPSL